MHLLGANLDLHLLLWQSKNLDLVDPCIDQFAFELAREQAQFVDLGGAADQQACHRFVSHELCHLGWFGFVGQVGEVVDLPFNLVQCEGHVAVFIEFEGDTGGPGCRSRSEFLQTVDAAQALLQRNGDTRLDIFRVGATPDSADGNLIEFKIGEKLNVQFLQRYDTGHQHHHHQQVGCNAMPRKHAEQAICHRSSP